MREHNGSAGFTGELSASRAVTPLRVTAGYAGLEVGELVRRAAAGDESAWVVLVDRYTPMLWAITRGYRLPAADAADVTQVAWLRLTQHLHTLRQPEHVAGWLATTVRRESLAVIRRTRREEPRELEDDKFPAPEDPAGGADERLLRRERDRIVQQAMQKLPSRQRMLLELLSADPPPNYKDISDATGVPIGSIGPTRARALRRLRTLLEQEGLRAG
jgi:RNA polymerase sigma factor (sigma-70 family)